MLNIIITLVRIPVKGFTVKMLWLWFLVPLGLIQISIVHAIALSMVFSYYTSAISVSDIKEEKNMTADDRFVYSFTMLIVDFIVLFVGFILSLGV
jgi:hypothetical protein